MNTAEHMTGGDCIRVVQPLFPVEGEGSIPISPLQLQVSFIDRKVFKELNRKWHSRLPICANCFEGICFGAHYKNRYYAVAWWTKPIASNRMKHGLKMLELRRMAINFDSPKNTASRFIKIMTLLIKDKKPDIFKLISYQDKEVHLGTIYKASGWVAQPEHKFISWKNRKDYNRIDQSKSIKIRWEKLIRSEPCQENKSVDTRQREIQQNLL
jgi:hypothetical protein